MTGIYVKGKVEKVKVDKLRQDYLKTEGLIPQKIKCPSCGKESDSIDVDEGTCLYWNGSKWVWGDPYNANLTFYCSECGEELPDSEELKVILETAND